MAVLLFCCSPLLLATSSGLWGTGGELWSFSSRLPDFSYAGYHSGEVAIPDPPDSVNVKNFGAVGDGTTDDTNAFLQAISAASNGAVFIPAGRYKITKQLNVNKSNVVLRGAGASQSVLFFPMSLTQAVGDPAMFARGGSWSWSGGLIEFGGDNSGSKVASITRSQLRGDTSLLVSTSAGLRVGQWIRVVMTDNDGGLMREILNGLGNGPATVLGRNEVDYPTRITAINGNTLTIERPMRVAINTAWAPSIYTDLPTIHDSGVEDLGFEYPDVPYPGHHLEPGYNGIEFAHASHCWVRNVTFKNCDSGIFLRDNTKFVTVQNIHFTADPGRVVIGYDDKTAHTDPVIGHHAVFITGVSEDNLVTGISYDYSFIHDSGVENAATGNVFAQLNGPDIDFDHHRRQPYENLFTDISAGHGTRLWESGGDSTDGPQAGARETFWNVRSSNAQSLSGNHWDVQVEINGVGVTTNDPSALPATSGNWWEAIPPANLLPANLYLAQLARRLNGGSVAPTPPSAPATLTATAPNSSQVNVAWTASTTKSVVGYNVLRGGKLIQTTSLLQFTDNTVAAATTYVYTVTAFDAAGNISNASPAASVFVPAALDQQPPSVPTNVHASTPSSALVNLTWNASTDNVGVTGYKVFRGNQVLGNSVTPQFADSTVTAGGNYTYTVAALDAAGNVSAQSVPATITVPGGGTSLAPTVPSNFHATSPDGTMVILAWGASTETGGSVSGYNVYRNNVLLGQTPSTQFTDMTVSAGQTYTYTLTAYDPQNNTSFPNTLTYSVAPASPGGLNASVGDGLVNLFWSTVSGANAYSVYRANAPGVAVGPANLIGTTNASFYTDSTLINGQAYHYVVVAQNSGGTSAPSNEISAVPLGGSAGGAIPAPPEFVSASTLSVDGTVLFKGVPGGDPITYHLTFSLVQPAGSKGTAAPAAVGATAGSLSGGSSVPIGGLHLIPGTYTLTATAENRFGISSPSATNIVLAPNDISSFRVFPNPWRADRHQGNPITFDNLPLGTTIKLFTLSAFHVRTLSKTDSVATWDLKNDTGRLVASGLYLYLITTDDGQKATGKLAIVR